MKKKERCSPEDTHRACWIYTEKKQTKINLQNDKAITTDVMRV